MMKKVWIGVGTIFIFGMTALLFNILSKPQKFTVPQKRVAFVAAFTTDSYWGMACNGAIEEGKKYGIDVKGLSSVGMSGEKLIENLEHAIYSDVDGIITYGMRGYDDFLKMLEKAEAQGIPVVLIDSDVDTEHRLAYVGTDNYLSGQLAAEELVQDCGGKGKILVVVSLLDTANQIDRVAGFQEIMDQYPDMEIVKILEGKSNTMLGQEIIMNAIQENPEINGIFCAEGVATISVCNAMRELNLSCQDIHVMTYDYSEAVEIALDEGYISATIQQDPKEMGKQAIAVLNQYLNGETLLNKELYTKIALIRKENIADSKNIDYGSVDIQWHYY